MSNGETAVTEPARRHRGSPWRVGWLDGPRVVDRPWIVTPSQTGDRLVACRGDRHSRSTDDVTPPRLAE